MIEEEIKSIMSNDQDDGTILNKMVDAFRGDRDPIEVMILLNSEDAELIAIGVWILNEFPFEKYDQKVFIDKLTQLTWHPSSSVRFNSIGALFPVFATSSSFAKVMLDRLRGDPNKGVKKRAGVAFERLFGTGI